MLDVKIGTVRQSYPPGRAWLRAALAHRQPTGERERYLGGSGNRSECGAGEARVRRWPCADLAELRSGYVDDALLRRPRTAASPPGRLCCLSVRGPRAADDPPITGAEAAHRQRLPLTCPSG